ncbi:hypothetical protein IE077_001838 [Cardiosporidium cionae]|uniref:Uncharacterized protein n=1 Tax=Cardiosporidium cionae TaxID=476202 RepID=A0ABQ7JCD5_9APIC|nr:hypothetical protein IE077_001838 [Cardiosporidium cionae]|eukprot:KAF8821595.1 hypothetical protein IE077_001838 [Cardiosporidium cionae]
MLLVLIYLWLDPPWYYHLLRYLPENYHLYPPTEITRLPGDETGAPARGGLSKGIGGGSVNKNMGGREAGQHVVGGQTGGDLSRIEGEQRQDNQQRRSTVQPVTQALQNTGPQLEPRYPHALRGTEMFPRATFDN